MKKAMRCIKQYMALAARLHSPFPLYIQFPSLTSAFRILCRNTFIPIHAPTLPPKTASESSVFSGIRLPPHLAFCLSHPKAANDIRLTTARYTSTAIRTLMLSLPSRARAHPVHYTLPSHPHHSSQHDLLLKRKGIDDLFLHPLPGHLLKSLSVII